MGLKSIRTVHACPVMLGDEACEQSVFMLYDAGRSEAEFYLVDDEVTCQDGHTIPHGVLEAWALEDSMDYAQRMQEDAESALYYHRSGGR